LARTNQRPPLTVARIAAGRPHLRPKSGTFMSLTLFTRRRKRMVDMGFGRGVLFWLLGIPIPIIILLALFWHH
jgi:hypothetical protein